MNAIRQSNILKSFKIAILNVVLVCNILIASYLSKANPIFSTIIGLLSLIIIILSVIGLINSLKSIREPNSIKKMIGLIVNFALVTTGLLLIIENVIDVLRVFK
jgi:hypothetical protein